MSSQENGAASNATHLKDDIDRGRTGDKAPGFDPAAAPLGTDEEAAGTPPSSAEIEEARRLERRPLQSRHPNAVEPAMAPDGSASGPSLHVVMGFGALALALIIIFIVLTTY
jgi:hypothetical protein